MARGHRHPGKACEQQREHRGEVGGHALVLLQLHHVHAHGLDDALAAHHRAGRDGQRARDHDPHGEAARIGRGAAEGKRDAQHGDGHELLTVSCAHL